MTSIIVGDLETHLLKWAPEIYDATRLACEDNTVDLENMKTSMLKELLSVYELNDDGYFTVAKIKYLKDFVGSWTNIKVIEFKERIAQRKDIIPKLLKLKQLILPEQRSEEWYKMRETILTASSLADAIGEGHFSTKEDLVLQKCGGPRGDVPFEIVEWGVMYEPVATSFYEIMNNVTILEFGLVPHPEFTIFGASPDGICDVDSPSDYIGRMLEIKCPPKRQFTKEVPKHYWMQMQGQLESCDLEECDFLQVKFSEYYDGASYKTDTMTVNDVVNEGYSGEFHLPKGLLLAFVTNNAGKNPTIVYEYSKFNQSYEQLILWKQKTITAIQSYGGITYDKVVDHWWKIERYECVLVGRDRAWWLETQPKIIDFWDDVEHYRKVGIQDILDKKVAKKKKRAASKNAGKAKAVKPKKTVYEIEKGVVDSIKNEYLIDSDNE